jgi:hypothetical protein
VTGRRRALLVVGAFFSGMPLTGPRRAAAQREGGARRRGRAAPRGAATGGPVSLQQPLAGAEVDWQAGLVIARAGAAADIRLPGPGPARAAAEQQARGRAAELLRGALKQLPLRRGRRPAPRAIEAALARLRPMQIEYQSNGGVLLSLAVRFGDLVAPAPEDNRAGWHKHAGGQEHEGEGELPDLVLAVESMPFEVAPTVLAEGKELAVSFAVYRIGVPPSGARAFAARPDNAGRLLVTGASKPPLSGPRAVVYVRSPAP